MGLGWIILAGAVAAAGVGALLRGRQRQHEARWRALVETAGLEVEAVRDGLGGAAVVNGYPVRLRYEGGLAVHLDARSRIPLDLTLEPRGPALPTGASAAALAVATTANARVLARGRGRGTLAIGDGWLIWRGRGVPRSRAALQRRLGNLVAVAEQLRIDLDAVPAQLAANAGHDPDPVVRERSLRVLIELEPDTQRTLSVCRGALDDAEGTVCVVAATGLGDAANAELERLVTAQSSSWSVQKAALVALTARLERPAVHEVLHRVLEETGDDTAKLAAIAHAQRIGYEPGADTWTRLMRHPSRAMSLAVASVIAELGTEGVETQLLELLDPRDDEVSVVALRALGEVGTVASVERLMDLTEGHPFRIRDAAWLAIEGIQQRARGAAPGQLAVVDEGPGELSVAPGEGALSDDQGEHE